jgi:hypothetical protein
MKLEQQVHICPLCIKPIAPNKAALDHDHKTGHIRSTLHTNCNGIEGRVLNYASRSGIDPVQFLERLLSYWKVDYTANPVHPTHLFPEQKEIKRIKKIMSKLKTDKAKPKYQAQINKLQRAYDAKYINNK